MRRVHYLSEKCSCLNACSIRMSYVLNECDIIIPKHNGDAIMSGKGKSNI